MVQDTTDDDTGSTPKPPTGKGRRKRRHGKSGQNAGPRVVVRPLAPPAKVERRHRSLFFTFFLLVVGPIVAAFYYLYWHAADQYASTVGFVVRSEESASAADLIGGLGVALGSSSGTRDSDILYEFIRSQELVRQIDEQVDLRTLFSRHEEQDPLLSFSTDGTIEDLVNYWDRMLNISYDPGSGLMELRVNAFEPQEAQLIAEAVLTESSRMINDLANRARADATRNADEDLAEAENGLIAAREALTTFRIQNEIVDPSADVQGQVGLLTTLQAQLAATLIEYDLLISSISRTDDPRVAQAELRLQVIENRIAQERNKFGTAGQGPRGTTYAVTIADFERLTADREFAELSYTAARAAYDAAVAEAQRQSRYLATYIRPTLAERAEYPQRALIIGIVALLSFLIWSILSLVYYALRDRR